MLSVLRITWPLLLGILLLMVGNGMQGTLLGIRGAIEGIGTTQMSVVMAAYFGGFVLGSLTVPAMIQRVGHVRVFAALGSLISAVLILYAAAPNWIFWALMRLLIGFSFCGVYITAESWVNASARNETRGQAMSAYFIVQMLGLVIGQILMNVGDPGGWMLFVIPSVLVSLAFTPILLAEVEAPRFETIAPMSIPALYRASPLGCVGIFLIGGVFSALLGMGTVWGTIIGLDVREISAFVAAIWIGGLVAQYPIGWLSDRLDRRRIIFGLAILGAVVTLVAFFAGLLAVVDGVLLVSSRFGMLDIFQVFFIVSAAWALACDREQMRARIHDAYTRGMLGTSPWGPRLGFRWWRFVAGVFLGLPRRIAERARQVLDHRLPEATDVLIGAARHQPGQIGAHAADRRGDGHVVVVQHHHQLALGGLGGVVHRLIGHAGGHRSVADDGHDAVLFALLVARGGEAQGGADRGRGVGRAERVVFAFAAFGKAGQAAALPQSANPVAPSGQDFVRVALVPHVPDQLILRRVEHIMDGGGQFHHAQPAAQMAAGYAHRANHFGAQFIGELAQLLRLQLAQIGGQVDCVQ